MNYGFDDNTDIYKGVTKVKKEKLEAEAIEVEDNSDDDDDSVFMEPMKTAKTDDPTDPRNRPDFGKYPKVLQEFAMMDFLGGKDRKDLMDTKLTLDMLQTEKFDLQSQVKQYNDQAEKHAKEEAKQNKRAATLREQISSLQSLQMQLHFVEETENKEKKMKTKAMQNKEEAATTLDAKQEQYATCGKAYRQKLQDVQKPFNTGRVDTMVVAFSKAGITDVRESLLKNLVLPGGAAMLLGLKHMGELIDLTLAGKLSDTLDKTYGFHESPATKEIFRFLEGIAYERQGPDSYWFKILPLAIDRKRFKEGYLEKGFDIMQEFVYSKDEEGEPFLVKNKKGVWEPAKLRTSHKVAIAAKLLAMNPGPTTGGDQDGDPFSKLRRSEMKAAGLPAPELSLWGHNLNTDKKDKQQNPPGTPSRPPAPADVFSPL